MSDCCVVAFFVFLCTFILFPGECLQLYCETRRLSDYINEI